MRGIGPDTYNDLDKLRATGQSFDGIISELIEKQEERTPEATA